MYIISANIINSDRYYMFIQVNFLPHYDYKLSACRQFSINCVTIANKKGGILPCINIQESLQTCKQQNSEQDLQKFLTLNKCWPYLAIL